MNRPLPWIAVAFIAGLWLGAEGLVAGPGAFALIGAAGLGVAVVLRRFRWVGSVALLAGFTAAGALFWHARHLPDPNPSWSQIATIVSLDPPAAVAVEGVVRYPKLALPGTEYTHFYLDAERIEAHGQPPVSVNTRLSVLCTNPGATLVSGERVRAVGRLDPALGRLNPGVRSVEDYLRRQGVTAKLDCLGRQAVSRLAPAPRWAVLPWVERLRNAEARAFLSAVPKPALPFVLAVWLGDRANMVDEEYEAFVRSGTAHVLAVSGVHIGIVFASAALLLRLLTRRKGLRALVLIAVVFLFAGLAGARVSSLRAALMIALYLTADLLDREPDAPTALSVAAMLFLLWSPDLLFDPGAQLSFLSVASILAFSEPIARAISRGPYLFRKGLATTLSVQILPLPVAIRTFHVLPLLAPLANLAVVPLLSVVLWLAFLTTLAAAVSMQAATLFGHALAPVVYAIEWIARAAAWVPGGHLSLTSPTNKALLLYSLAVFLGIAAFRHTSRRRVLTAGCACALAVMAVCWRPFSAEPEVVFLDVGHGDATFVRAADGTTALIDGGDAGDHADYGARVILPFLWGRQVGHLDYAVVTHPDRDHLGGMLTVLAHMPVRHVVLGPVDSERPLERALLALCAARRIPVERLAKGDQIVDGALSFDVLHPPADWATTADVNNASLVLRLNFSSVRVLLPGDIELEGERVLTQTDVAADVLKAPHHGSATSSGPALLRAVQPALCVVSTGGTRGREAANPAVLARYRDLGIPAYRTDLHGAVRLTCREGRPVATSERAARGYPVLSVMVAPVSQP